ncbi:MAG: hypothetical protein R2720_01720 [Candidatus Nanopelagicales bacterium]
MKLLVAAILLIGMASPSHAETVTVKNRSSLPASGTAKVKVSGLPKNVGVYVRLCKKPRRSSTPRPSECLNTGGQYAGVWVVGRYPYGPRPKASNIAKPNKSFRLPVRSKFGSVDCKRVKCAIVVRRDHRNGSDASYNRAIRVRFR